MTRPSSPNAPPLRLQTLSRDPNMVTLRVGGKKIGDLLRRDAERLKLADGQGWTETIASKVSTLVEETRCRKEALKLLAARSRFASELGERLERKGFESRLARKVAKEMVDQGWIDERTQAASLAELLRRKGHSETMVRRKLERSGACEEAIQWSLRSTTGVDDGLLLVAERRLRTLRTSPRKVAARRLFGYLARRGHEEQDIVETLQRLGLPTDSMGTS